MSATPQHKTIAINLEEECPKLKSIYDNCFSKWYSNEFLAGKANENVCHAEWDIYKSCMIVAVTEKELRVGLDKISSPSPSSSGEQEENLLLRQEKTGEKTEKAQEKAEAELWNIKTLTTIKKDDLPANFRT